MTLFLFLNHLYSKCLEYIFLVQNFRRMPQENRKYHQFGWPKFSIKDLCIKLTKLCGFSSQTNYTYRATAAYRRIYRQLLRIESVAWSAQWIPTAVNLDFLDPEPLLFHSSSSSVILTRLSGPSSRPTTSQKIW
jgi:hypothetical protein